MTGSFDIGVLAERTGVSQGRLRTWENRFGFPSGERGDNGRRRFTDADVGRVERVLSAKADGLPLAVAIDSVLAADEVVARSSVFSSLSARFGSIPTERLSRASMLRLSRALEDDCLRRADGDVVLGGFQRSEHVEESSGRWEELARTATWCAVVADFGGRPRSVKGGPVRGHLSGDAPMRREWTVITLGHSQGAVLSGWEVPGTGDEEFEAVFSVRPAVAQVAAQALVGILTASRVDVPAKVMQRLSVPPAPPDPEATDRLLGRAIGYLAGGDREAFG